MALRYGMNITASDMKKLLEENDKQQSGVRSWRQLFGNASLGYEAQSRALRSDYASAIAEAYKSNLAQQNALIASGLSTGATKEMIGANRRDLQNAYDTYIRNYNQNASGIAENYNAEVSSINQALTERATNFANLYDSAYKYLSEELAGSSFANPAGETIDVLTDQGLDWLYTKDAEGNLTTDLMPWHDLSNILFNSNGVMTDRGREFYDAMFNLPQQEWQNAAGERTRTFDEWLSQQTDTFGNYDATNLPGMAKTGKELRDWWVSQDDFNYTFAGTNKGTAQSSIGLESADQNYVGDKDIIETVNPVTIANADTAITDITAHRTNFNDTYANIRSAYNNKSLSYDKASDETNKAWKSYIADVGDEFYKLDKLFIDAYGREEFNKFIQGEETKGYYSAYKNMMSEAKSLNVNIDTTRLFFEVSTRLTDAYKQYLSAMNAFKPSPKITKPEQKKSSGF